MKNRPPDAFDSLAAINRLSNSDEYDEAFYERYRQTIDFAAGFIGFFASQDRNLSPLPRFKGAPLDEVATILRDVMKQPIPNLNVEWFDQQMTIVMRSLLPIVRDPALPDFLHECRWGIEGAFYPAS